MFLNRLTKYIDPKLIPEQAGFRPGKSCCSQVLNLTQYIEDGYETGDVTGVVFVDLTAAYDTVNLKRLIWKVGEATHDDKFIGILRELLHNRRYQVHLLSEKSKWRSLRNGLPQGSVLAPLLFNIYTNDQPLTPGTKSFIYADDLALAAKYKSFEEIETNLSKSLKKLDEYYIDNALKPNPSKTYSCAFHLRNSMANRQLKLFWRGVPITHNSQPVYLGITLDRALTYKAHCSKTKHKVSARNNLLRRLTTTKWGATPKVLRTTGLALSFSAGEYACPVWSRSAHAKSVDIALNETCRCITGCLKPTPVQFLYPLAGIAPPAVRRSVTSSVEKRRQEQDPRHPLQGKRPARSRLKSRNSFLTRVASTDDASKARIHLWTEKYSSPTFVTPRESLPPGHNLPWSTWKSLNRLRTGVGRCRENLSKWGYTDNNKCGCGVPQTMDHLKSCPACPATCTQQDFCDATDNAIRVAEFWSATI